MKVRDRIAVITDLFLGAAYADRRFPEDEKRAVRRLLCELIVRDVLPVEVEQRIETFDPAGFDLDTAAREFLRDPPMHKRRLLELVAQLSFADGELDLAEDDYLHALGRALGMEPADYQDIVLDYEIQDLRRSFELIRPTGPELFGGL